MNTQSNAMPESPLESLVSAPAVISASRRMYWSLRRELWESRSIYIAPLAVAALILFGFLISTIRLPHKMRALSALDPAHQREAVAMPYDFAAGLIMATAFIVGVFYCLDALHGERRDRSILFWKSLPVSDLTTVLAKASIPLIVLPLLSFAATVATQFIMLLLSSAVLLGSGQSVATLWTQLSLFQMSLLLLYHLVTVHALWYAPIYGWLLLVSGWARRGSGHTIRRCSSRSVGSSSSTVCCTAPGLSRAHWLRLGWSGACFRSQGSHCGPFWGIPPKCAWPCRWLRPTWVWRCGCWSGGSMNDIAPFKPKRMALKSPGRSCAS